MLRIDKPLKARKRLALTPLIDVIFILVMFFLLSSTFGVWQPLDVSLRSEQGAGGTNTAAPAKAPSVLMTIRSGQEPNTSSVTINGIDFPKTKMVEELNRLAGLGAEDVFLLPADDIDFQEVVTLLDLARSSNIARISMKVD
ncbi:ExbD/TolR family protein [Roseibium sp.]|uniref:ExbD/TolR family protein n=1 Tax=Roseibium sp. TaxID=1936156 RepID=UPI003B52F9B2